MVDTTPGAPSASLRRDAILQAVADAAERLLLAPDWRYAAEDVLARLGMAADVSRVYVIENHLDPSGATLGSLSFEWCAPGIPSNAGNEFLSAYDWEDGFARFAALHRAGEAVMGAVESFLPEERPELERQGVVSLVEFPVMVLGEWWGSIGFDDCERVREWSGAEVDALRVAATLLGASIQRHQREDAGRRSERRYRQLVEKLPGITYTDERPVEGGAAVQGFVSPQVLDILGYPPERFTSDSQFWFNTMHPDDLARLRAANAFNSNDTSVFDQEYRMITADGRTVWLHDSSIPIFAADGSLEYFLGFARDITRRKIAEDRQRETEQRYRDLVERLPAVTYLRSVEPGTSTTGATTYMSPLIERILGYPVERWYSDVSFHRTIAHPEDRELIGSIEAASEATGEPFSYEHRMIAADGRVVWVHEEAVLIRDAGGEPQYWQGFILDITERKQAGDQLRRAEERFRLIVERTPAVTYQEPIAEAGSYDLSAVVSYVSPQIEAILGFGPAQWSQPGFTFSRIHPDDREQVQAEGSAKNDTGEPYRQDYRMLTADGRIVWFHDDAQLIRDDDGRSLYWQGVMVDITERKEAEEQLRQAEERFRMIVERTPAIVYQELPSGTSERAASVVFASAQIERILGYPQDAWTVPGAWVDMIHPDDRQRMLDRGSVASDEGAPYSDEYRMIAADGREVWFHDEAVLITDDHGLPLMWQGVMVDITDQKTVEERLRATEERYRALVEHIPAIVYAEAIVSNVEELYLSPQVERVLGHTPEEWKAVPRFWVQHLHPDDRDRVVEANRVADETAQPFIEEYRLLAKDGEYRWIHDEAVRVNADDGEPLFWQGVLVDITEQKRAELGLRDAQERYRALVEHIPAVVFTETLDADPERFYISPQVEEVFGWTADEWRATAEFWFDHVHPDDLAIVRETDARANETLQPYAIEYRFAHRDGRWRWVRDEATFLSEPDGAGYWQGFLLDITSRKESEDALREAELKFRTIVEQNQAIFYTQEIDPDDPSISNTTYVAPGNTDMIGYTLAEIQADPALWRRIVHPDDRARVWEADAASNRELSDENFSLEYRMIAKDGRIVWVQDEARVVRLPGKEPYWQGFLLDITERKQAEAQLERALAVEREAAQRLRTLDEMKNTFLQAVSHDLRTPLAAILGLAITLERSDVQLEAADARDLAHRIAGNARRLDRLVTNLLDLDRLSRGIVAPQLEPTDLGDLARRAIAESELLSSARVRTDIEPTVLPLDASKVERIIENLLANTARHTPASATIWVRVHPVDGGGLIAIEDNGTGVALELREAIFEPFRQGPDAPSHSPGVGVGLTLVRRFAELHGGRAWVEEREGGGASFRVFFPSSPPPYLDASSIG
ncbi:MAG: PAS domain-containing protein [Actinomycetota bacterium]